VDHGSVRLRHDPRRVDPEPAVGAPRGTEREALAPSPDRPSTSGARRRRPVEANGASPPRLRRLADVVPPLVRDRTRPKEYLAPDEDDHLVEVDVLPLEPEEFAAAEPGRKREAPDRREPVRGGGVEEWVELQDG